MIQDEIKLIHAAKNGDKESFSKLLKIHQVKLRTFLIARCQNRHDADDILQETCINAFQYISTYNEKWKFNTWLFTIAIRLIRKQQKFSKSNMESSEILNCIELDELSIDTENIWIQISKILSKQSYDILWFFYVEDLSTKEIAHILQRSNSWVKIILYRSRKKLATSKNLRELSKEYLIKGMTL